jgi:RNA polymerase sigma-70 factor (ECF subfamily)
VTSGFQVCDPDELARLAREGDVAVLDSLTRCYGERLFAIGRRHCRDQEDAEDAVQDALLSAGMNLQSYRGDSALEAWVGRMVANACHKMTRGLKNSDALHVTEVDLEGGDSPELAARRAELARELGEALLELPPKDRVIVLLAETEDWTGPQIAEKLEMTPAAVRQRLSRARLTLQAKIERGDH